MPLALATSTMPTVTTFKVTRVSGEKLHGMFLESW